MFGRRRDHTDTAALARAAVAAEEAAQRAELFASVACADFIARPNRTLDGLGGHRIAAKIAGSGTVWLDDSGEAARERLAERFPQLDGDTIRRAVRLLDERAAGLMEQRSGVSGERYARLKGGGSGWI